MPTAQTIPAGASISRVGMRGRSAGKWLRGVGNIGLALCRVETMTDVVLPGETAAAAYNPENQFVVARRRGWERPLGEDQGVRASVVEATTCRAV